jgi:patatin-like phospholipase/acyl hydrolase
MQLWTNYNYPPTVPASASSFRINTAKAVRITSAAPSYFTAVLQEGSIYVDGAIVANNPTDVAMREAKKLYNEDLELILSIGTGLYSGDSSSYEWSGIANSLICSSTDTERIHEIVDDFYGRDKYFRLNPPLDVNVAIDAKSAETLAYLKQVGKEYVSKYENEQPEKFARLMRLLRYQYN